MTSGTRIAIAYYTSFEDDLTQDKVPIGSTLVSTFSNESIYTRVWRLPICITINDIQYLKGDGWLSKIDTLLYECSIPVQYIQAFEFVNNHTIKLHFQRQLLAIRIKKLLENYVKKNYEYGITIHM